MSDGSELDAHGRDYKKMVVDRSQLVEKIPDLSKSAANALLRVAQDIAIADGFLDRQELTFLQDIYRAFGWSVRGAKFDLKKHAETKHIDMEDYSSSKLIPEAELDEFDNVLGDLLFDYDDF